MQGIEPKFHNTLIERAKYYRYLLVESQKDTDSNYPIDIDEVSELGNLYEEYLKNKSQLEKSIKKYKECHKKAQAQLSLKIRIVRRNLRNG
ncbi:hypothetical protein [Chryseobacterium indoltheticum]|uniref:Uncharacterized protein n=1 Tax=Chryseobacterium indoltheticum TaxID=254 RepID=A0A381FER3_9FLAO|nr:hypothetical protein [Chryseobacterium indoltheticum]AZA74265.1 hypothetical protein EG358_11100 [Chryseobacterium indoltheticum]SIR35015.1 hypothetical protein SAMN05421682_11929 [Chryseobacterium indoltheticum]SUX45039.1 Uncharacterised protein [Chryseobacterium indoltheticum]